MRVKLIALSGVIIGLIFISTSWAGDYSSYSMDELMEMRDNIHNMSQQQQNTFHEEMHSRYRSMMPDERGHYDWGQMHNGTGMSNGRHYELNGWDMHDGTSGYDHDRSGRFHRTHGNRGGGC